MSPDHGVALVKKIISQFSSLSSKTHTLDSRIPGGIFFTHSIKSPLTTLRVSLSELKEMSQLAKDPQACSYLQSAEVATQQIQALIDVIPRPNHCPTETVVDIDETLQRLKILFHKKDRTYKLVFNIKLKSSQAKIKLNKLYFWELMSCLINNGFEAYDKPNRNKVVIVTVVERKKYLEIQVQDFGQGANYFVTKLMTASGFTTKNTGQGFGMWFVKKIVESQCHSKLRIFSEKGLGTIVRFRVAVL